MISLEGNYRTLIKKVIFEQFSLAFTVFDIHISNCDLENTGHGHGVQHSQWHNAMANTQLPI